MFKRINKRQKKLAKEEELGLDAEMKQVLGLNDTDSEESFSSGSDSDKSDMGNESDNEGTSMVDELMDVDETLQLGRLGKRQRGQAAHGSSSEEEDDVNDGGLAYSETESVEDDEMEQDEAPMSISNALKNPIYDVPGVPEIHDIRACAICPGKLLKNAVMVKVHLQSQSHVRRMRHFTVEVKRLEASPNGLQTDDPRDILDILPQFNTSAPEAGAMSKRAQRKNEWKAKRKEKLKKKKEARLVDATAAQVKMEPSNVIEKKTDASNKSVHFPAPSTSNKLSKPKLAMKTKQLAESRPKKKAKRAIQSPATETSVMRVLPMRNSPSGDTDKPHHAPPLDHRSTSFYFADDELNRDSATPKSSKTQEEKEEGIDLLNFIGVKKHNSAKSFKKLPKAVAEKSKLNLKNKRT